MLSFGWFPASEVYMPTFRNTLFHLHRHLSAYEDGTECSETSAYTFQTPGNHPKESIQHSGHGESLKSRLLQLSFPSVAVVLTLVRNMNIQVSQEECARLREGVPYVKVYRYNPKHLHPNLNGYGDNGQRSLKLRQLLHTYWLPNTYWNWQEYVVSVMLISVLNIKLICEWYKAIKLNYKNTRTHVMVVLRVTKQCT